MVRAKFKVDSKEYTQYTSGYALNAEGKEDYSKPNKVELCTVKMSPVYGNSDPNHENTKFWKASPSGRLELGSVNKSATDVFELGKEYYVDFTPANENNK